MSDPRDPERDDPIPVPTASHPAEPPGIDLAAIERDVDVFERARDAATEGVWLYDPVACWIYTDDEDDEDCIGIARLDEDDWAAGVPDGVFIALAHETPLPGHVRDLVAEVRRLRRAAGRPGARGGSDA